MTVSVGKPNLTFGSDYDGRNVQGIFVGTFLIGLREGLEATLIVSIVGAFLDPQRQARCARCSPASRWPSLISIAVGVGLDLLSSSLPQRQQEMLETVIGAIAVVFVTTMIIWMNRNAFRMKGELEREAAQAINGGGSLALAVMAFLAVLKEGFETAVFLLAAAQTSQGNRWFAVFGGAAGIAHGRRDRRRHLLRRPEAQPRPLLPRHRRLPGASSRRAW